MKKLLLFATLFAMAFLANAQVPTEQTITFEKKAVQGVTVVVDGYTVDVVAEALKNRFEKTSSLKGKKGKSGYYNYLNQTFLDFSPKNLDIYTLVEVDGKRKSGQVAVSILVSTGNQNFISSTNDAETFEKVKRFLTAFNAYLKEYDTNKKIAEQRVVLSGLEKDREKMSAEVDKWKKQINELEAQSLKREKELEAKNAEIEKANMRILELSRIMQSIVPAVAE